MSSRLSLLHSRVCLPLNLPLLSVCRNLKLSCMENHTHHRPSLWAHPNLCLLPFPASVNNSPRPPSYLRWKPPKSLCLLPWSLLLQWPPWRLRTRQPPLRTAESLSYLLGPARHQSGLSGTSPPFSMNCPRNKTGKNSVRPATTYPWEKCEKSKWELIWRYNVWDIYCQNGKRMFSKKNLKFYKT